MLEKIKSNKSYIIIGVIILLVIAVFVFKKTFVNVNNSNTNTNTNITPIYKTYKVYNFGSSLCPACSKMEPIYEKIKGEYSNVLNFEYINVDDDYDLAIKYKIRYTPTFVVVDETGAKVDELIGYTPEANFREFVNKWSEK